MTRISILAFPDSCLPRFFKTHSCVALRVPVASSPRDRWLGEIGTRSLRQRLDCWGLRKRVEPLAVYKVILPVATRGCARITWLLESLGGRCGWTSESPRLPLLCFSLHNTCSWPQSLGTLFWALLVSLTQVLLGLLRLSRTHG